MYDTDMNQLEFGIDPDVKVDMTSEDMQQGKDTMIEKACEILKNWTQNLVDSKTCPIFALAKGKQLLSAPVA